MIHTEVKSLLRGLKFWRKVMDAIAAYHSKRERFSPPISMGDGEFTYYIEGYPVEEEAMPYRSSA